MSLEIRDSSTPLRFARNDKAAEVFIEVPKHSDALLNDDPMTNDERKSE